MARKVLLSTGLSAMTLCAWSLLLLGAVSSGFLLFRSFALVMSRPSDWDLCAFLFGSSCDPLLVRAESLKLGIPLAGWGVIYFLTLATLLFLSWVLGEGFQLEARIGALLLAGAGTLAAIALTAKLIRIGAYACYLCLAVHLIMIVALPVLWRSSGLSTAQVRSGLLSALKYLAGAKVKSPQRATWTVLAFVTTVLVAIVLYQWVLLEWERRFADARSRPQPERVVADFEKAPRLDIAVYPEDPLLGSIGSPLQMVVFSSFQCPGCRSFSRLIPELMDHYGGKLAIVFKHFPLAVQCNPSLQSNMQPQACEAAWACEAAHHQGGFWPFHDGLFATDLRFQEETFLEIAREVGLDVEQFNEERRAEHTRAKVSFDVAQGAQLGVDATPAIFLNGKRVRQVSLDALKILCNHELGH